MSTKTIYTTNSSTRTFAIGEKFTTYVGGVATLTEVVGFESGAFQIRYAGSGKVYDILGGVLAKALSYQRRPLEVLNAPRSQRLA